VLAATAPRRPAFALATTAAATLAHAAKHLHLVGDDVGRVAFDALLVGVLVGAQRAFDVDLAALLQVLTGDLGQAAEEFHAMPLGAFLLLAGLLVRPLLGGGDADRGDGRAGRRVPGLRVVAQVAYQDDLVDASCHALGSCCSGRQEYHAPSGRLRDAIPPRHRKSRRAPVVNVAVQRWKRRWRQDLMHRLVLPDAAGTSPRAPARRGASPLRL